MLYTFTLLAQKLTQLGYPEATESGFRIIKRDLTQEENAGNVEFKSDGVFLTIDGQEYKGYMYLKYADITRFGLPKFHITNCQTILEQRANGRFEGRYFWHNSNTVSIEDRSNGQIHENINLGLCNYCRNQALTTGYTDTEGFFSLLDIQEQDDINQEYEVDIFGYTTDWQKISREYKKEKEYTCESCHIKIENPVHRRYIHTHHKSGNKLNNKRSNLECLCVLCHSFKDDTHRENFDTGRMKSEIKSFISKYSSDLINLKNPFINHVVH